MLADHLHVIARDHLRFDLPAGRSADGFDYSFDALADITEARLADLGIDRHAVEHDDAPIDWRAVNRISRRATPGVRRQR